MSFLSGILNLFQTTVTSRPEAKSDKVIEYLISLVNPSQGSDFVRKYNTLKQGSPSEFLYIPLYLSLEEFILKNKPPLVKEHFTRESLRSRIKTIVDINQLPLSFRLIFLEPNQQTFYLFELATQKIAQDIIRNLGVSHFVNLISEATRETPLQTLSPNREGLNFSALQLKGLPSSETISLFKQFYNALHQKIIFIVGQNIAADIFYKSYKFIKDTYNFELTSQFVEALPEGTIGSDKLAFLSREQLEQKVAEAVGAEKEKRELAEKLSRELEIEKQSVELKVQERTKELALAKTRTEEEKSKAEAILQSIGDGVFAVDLEKNIMLMNPIAELLTKVNFANAIGKNYKDVFKFAKENKSQDSYPDFIESTIKEGVIKKLENHTILIRHDGTSIPILDSAAPIRDKDGKILGGIVVIRDASRERALEQAKDEFISIAAHQLRTPLGSMRWNIETILKENNLEIKTKTKINMIYQSNLHIINLVDNLLNISRIDQGRVHDEPQPTNIIDVVRQTVNELDGEAQKRHIAIDLQFFQDNIPLLNIDPNRFREVIENLISNAVKYSLPEGKVAVSVVSENENIKLGIADSGIGIPKADQNRVFSKFYRAQNAARSEQSGSGLGLFVVKSYVEGWGGKVWFESIENHGTTFWVEIPIHIQYTTNKEDIKPMQPEDNTVAQNTTPSTPSGKKILIIEDDQNYQQAYIDRLPQEGFQVFQAFTGKEGLEIARKENPNLILLDIMLPGGMNGFDVLEQLKMDRNLFNTPVIMLTNLDSERKTALTIGATDYMVKADTSIDQVVEKVRQCAS